MTEGDEEVSLMNEREYLAERFEEHRRDLRAVAYRMLGSLSEVPRTVSRAASLKGAIVRKTGVARR
jgi:DNA-directed RNA polymerase specialized sigma24 family protein